jgi:hypothetical protein
MAKITLDVPDDLLTQLTQGENDLESLEIKLLELVRLSLSPGNLPATVYRYVLDFLISNPTPQQLLDFKPTAAMQARLQELVGKYRSGNVTLSEQQELDEYEQIEHLLVMLKAGNLRYITTSR